MRREYSLGSDVLETVIATAPVTQKHVALLSAFATRTDFVATQYVASGNEYAANPARILAADGSEVASDYRGWVREQLDAHAGDVAAICAEHQDKGYLVTEVESVLHYFACDRGGAQDNFVQCEIWEEQEFVERELFARSDWTGWGRADSDDLWRGSPGLGYERKSERRLIGAPTYRLECAVDMHLFTALAESTFADHHRKAGDLRFQSTDAHTGETRIATVRDLTPGYDKRCSRERRIFEDWTQSSAGRAGERICTRWAFKTSDWTDPRGERTVTFIPKWAHRKKIAGLKDTHRLDVYGLYGRLNQFDQRVGMPFAWYFYGLHGNLVLAGHLQRVLEGAERGLIVMPEHDYQILRRWGEASYGF